ncbi:MAG TPA: hypothetical protein VGX03_32325 [Candidatus Binatia bacterium]|jgi:hypothetical protein|nr:hypothetical protein [Candidatus Binatia bacterium]
MRTKSICLAAVLAVFCATAALADSPSETVSAPEKDGGTFSVVRTVLYFPFKGVVCVVGATVSFPVYWLSGLDPQVKKDTAALRAKYCSQDYLLGSTWTK